MKISRFWGSLITLTVMMTSLLAPLSVSAQSADPYNESLTDFLSELDLEFQPGDAVWSDPTFVEFADSYQELENLNLEYNQILQEMALQFKVLFEKILQVNDTKFQQQLDSNEDTLQFIEELKTILDLAADSYGSADESNSFDQIFNIIFEQIIDRGLSAYDYDDTIDEDEYFYGYPYVYGYVEGEDSVDAGKLIRMNSEAYDFESTELDYEWTQISGPEVTLWMNTDLESDIAFIVPQYDILGDETFMEFEVTVTDEFGNEASGYVWVNLIMG